MSMEHRRCSEACGRRRRVLVVDDHASFRRCASKLLSSEGYDVVGEAADGASALALAARLRPELVLLDIQLPDIDGFAVAERLLATPAGAADRARLEPRPLDHGPLIETSGARGFIAKGDLTGAALERLLE